ncbi:MAG: glycerol kinase GlpK [Lachnospiraceae bacterium]|nr:glycerol kinase GlpK [Lachnospiraceae bacterium]
MGNYVMSFDAGTSSERAIIFDRMGAVAGVAQKPITQYFPQAGWVEHDPEEILSVQLEVACEAMKSAGLTALDIDCIGITNQRETTIVWDKATGKPVYNAIVWQCRRTALYCREIAEYAESIRDKTGLVLDPYFSATKIAWILDNVEGVRARAERGELLFGTVECWLIWNLTKGERHVTDYSNASRTMLFNIHTLMWDEDICRLLKIPMNMLPKVVGNSEIYGETAGDLLPGGSIRIAGAAGDQQAALFGQKAFNAGDIKNTYGTGCFLLMNTGEKPVRSEHGLVTTIAWGRSGKITYALEGSVFMGGALIQWIRDELGLVSSSAETEELAHKAEDTNGCYIVPAFTGLGAPYWKPDAKGIITGLTRGVGKNHIVRAALDAIVYQVNDIVAAMQRDTGKCGTGNEVNAAASKGEDSRADADNKCTLRVDGGASANNYLLQMQADISNMRVVRPACVESTAMGAAYLAGLATGFWSESDIAAGAGSDTVFEPRMDETKRAELVKGWQEAVRLIGG